MVVDRVFFKRNTVYKGGFVFFLVLCYDLTMKAYLSRRYAVDILLPCPQTQKTMVGIFIQRTIGKGSRNRGAFLKTQAGEGLLTESGEEIITEQPGLPIRTFRIRHGNGYGGTILNELIQEQYDYYVPDPNASNFTQADKDDFAAAVTAWKALSDNEKKYYNNEAVRLNLHMAGFNLYIRKYRLGLL